MKYGNIIYNKRNGRLNFGDDMQLLAIENLYGYMGIDYNEVLRIELSDMYTWSGEDVLVPISFPIIGYNDQTNITCFSEKIHPVFIGLSILAETLSVDDIQYLNRYSPIGCRDYHTYHIMQKYNIPSYLFGCMTLTFPLKRSNSYNSDKVFCVDISGELSHYIPEEIIQECIYLSNSCDVDELQIAPEEKARNIYEMLIKDARLVVTSRLHVALPCIAAGIPVIFAKDVYSYRFAGVNRIVNIYDKEQYDKIEWNPEPLRYEEIKEKMLELVANRVRQSFNEYNLIEEYDSLYEDDIKNYGVIETLQATIRYLEKRYTKDERFKYVLWSVTQTANLINETIKDNWKNAKLVAVIDKNKVVEFDGIVSEKKDCLLKHKDAVILVCSDAAIKEASEYFHENNLRDYFYCFNG